MGTPINAPSRRMHAIAYRMGITILTLGVTAGGAMAQTTQSVVIGPSRGLDAYSLESNGTGFFVNDDGDVLTARHVVEACNSLFIIKGGQVARASIKAKSSDKDLAVISSRIKPFLSARFPKTDNVKGAEPVFTAGYEVLRHMPDRSTTMYNALTRDKSLEKTGELTLISSATNGASGSPVLNEAGLVVGLVIEREMVIDADPRSYAIRSSAATYVIAVSGDPIKAFLAASKVPFEETDVPQLESTQPHAPRAATLEAGVLCGG